MRLSPYERARRRRLILAWRDADAAYTRACGTGDWRAQVIADAARREAMVNARDWLMPETLLAMFDALYPEEG